MIGVRELTRDFGPVRALDAVTLAFRPGEIHGLIGENGAGKSTLMNVLAGTVTHSAGSVVLHGKDVRFMDPADALRAGVAMVHQELNLVPELTVADNVSLGREPVRRRLLDLRLSRARARELLAALGCPVDPRTPVRELSIAGRQMVEIAKALAVDAQVLILDEPTAVLGRPDIERLFVVLRRLRAEGRTVIYVSHMLPEVLELCDRISVLRDGRLVTTLDEEETRLAGEEQLAGLMVGRELGEHFPPRGHASAEVVLEVRGVTVPGVVQNASLEVRRGEIVGLAGLVGAGRTELAEALFGLRRAVAGEVRLSGRVVRVRRPEDAVAAGIAYVPEDRRGAGLVMGLGVIENATLVSLRKYCHPLISRRAEREAVEGHAGRLRIKAPRLRAPVETLSGGNQQKVAIAKWLETVPDVLILDEPTRGVDIGAKEELYRLIVELAEAGTACLLISSELNEVLALSHRIAVMRQGRIVAVLDGATASEESVMRHAAGVAREAS